MSLQGFKDAAARAAHGMTKAEALEKGLCISCKTTPFFHSELGRKEYCISGIGETCFDSMFTCSRKTCADSFKEQA